MILLNLDPKSGRIYIEDENRTISIEDAEDLIKKNEAIANNRAFRLLIRVGFNLNFVKDIYRGW